MLPIIKVQPSKKLYCFAVSVYLGACLAIIANSLPWYVKITLLGITFINGKKYIAERISLKHSDSVVAFSKSNDHYWSIKTKNQEVQFGELQKNSFVTQFLLVLNFNCHNRLRLSVMLTPESVGKENFRRLLVYLRHSQKKLNCHPERREGSPRSASR